MRVAPLNHYQLLVVDPFLQLDSIKNRVSRGCASFTCFSCGGASAGLDTTTTPCPPLKVEPLQHPVVSSSPPPESVSVSVPEKGKDLDANKADDNISKEAFKLSLRSSLKRPPSVVESRSLEGIKEHETLSVHDDGNDLTGGDDMGRRKVQWPDACGSELTQVREFEPSEMGLSDEEWETGQQRTCSCVIM
ncbi:hypothetical protein N665_0165s0046 [Sinapis alba]|nr:hypothetical protein N665_0165s0046 [Sinapis alba]